MERGPRERGGWVQRGRGEEAVVLEEKLSKVAVALDMNLVLALLSPCQGKRRWLRDRHLGGGEQNSDWSSDLLRLQR